MKEFPQGPKKAIVPKKNVSESAETIEPKEKIRSVSLNGVAANIYKSQHVYQDENGWHYDPCNTINIDGSAFGYGGHVYVGKEKKILEMKTGMLDLMRIKLGLPRKEEHEFNKFIRKIPARGDVSSEFKNLYFALEELVSSGTFYEPTTGDESMIANKFSWDTKQQITITELVSVLMVAGIKIEDQPAGQKKNSDTLKEV